MKLSEKIYDCRKKAGLSQEALAEKLGVSRQAVSKWETGEAVPELEKLLRLSQAFGVSTDWLLSEEEPEEPGPSPEDGGCDPDSGKESAPLRGAPSWLEEAPGFLGRMLRRWGWLFGVYVALGGLTLLIGGLLMGAISSSFGSAARQLEGFPSYHVEEPAWYDEEGNSIDPPAGLEGRGRFSGLVGYVDTISTAAVVIGLVIILAGVVLAVYLRKKGGK